MCVVVCRLQSERLRVAVPPDHFPLTLPQFIMNHAILLACLASKRLDHDYNLKVAGALHQKEVMRLQDTLSVSETFKGFSRWGGLLPWRSKAPALALDVQGKPRSIPSTRRPLLQLKMTLVWHGLTSLSISIELSGTRWKIHHDTMNAYMCILNSKLDFAPRAMGHVDLRQDGYADDATLCKTAWENMDARCCSASTRHRRASSSLCSWRLSEWGRVVAS